MKLKTIYIFGDSLHDTGNLKKLTNGEFPSKAYFDGRFSNGPVYCEYLAETLSKKNNRHIMLKNYAVGGALTNYVNGYSPKSTSLMEQIGAEDFSFTENDLVILGCGANNYGFFIDIKQFPFIHLKRLYNLADDLKLCVQKIIDKGAKHILLFNVPNIFMAPVKRKLSPLFKLLAAPLISNSLDKTNKKIEKFVNSIDGKITTIVLFDVYKLFKEALSSPEKFDFKYSDFYVIPGLGRYDGEIANNRNHEEYLFWDFVHPTTKGHKLLSHYITELINEKFFIE